MVSEFVTKHFYTFKTGILLNVNFTTLFMDSVFLGRLFLLCHVWASVSSAFCLFRWNLFSSINIFSSSLALAVKSSQLKRIPSLSKAIGKAVQVFVVYSHKTKIYSLCVFLNININNQEVGSFALEHCTAIAYTQLNDDRKNKRENQTEFL